MDIISQSVVCLYVFSTLFFDEVSFINFLSFMVIAFCDLKNLCLPLSHKDDVLCFAVEASYKNFYNWA